MGQGSAGNSVNFQMEGQEFFGSLPSPAGAKAPPAGESSGAPVTAATGPTRNSPASTSTSPEKGASTIENVNSSRPSGGDGEGGAVGGGHELGGGRGGWRPSSAAAAVEPAAAAPLVAASGTAVGSAPLPQPSLLPSEGGAAAPRAPPAPETSRKGVRWVDDEGASPPRSGDPAQAGPAVASCGGGKGNAGGSGGLRSILKGGALSAGGGTSTQGGNPSPLPGTGTIPGYRMEKLVSVRVFDQFEECSAVERGDSEGAASGPPGGPLAPGSAVGGGLGWAEARRLEREKEKKAMNEIQARSRVVLKEFSASLAAMEGDDADEWTEPLAMALTNDIENMAVIRRDKIADLILKGVGADIDTVISDNPDESLRRSSAPPYSSSVQYVPLDDEGVQEWQQRGIPPPKSQYESYRERSGHFGQHVGHRRDGFGGSRGGGFGAPPQPPPPPRGGFDWELSETVGATLNRLQGAPPPPSGGYGGNFNSGQGGSGYGMAWRPGPDNQWQPPPPPTPMPMPNQKRHEPQQQEQYYHQGPPPGGSGFWGGGRAGGPAPPWGR